jgi:hypothetical protein
MKLNSKKKEPPVFGTSPSLKDTYIIIGPKNCGKTVFLVTVIDRLQRLANESEHLKVEYKSTQTCDFVQDSLMQMRQSLWPAETPPAGNRLETGVFQKGFLWGGSEDRLILMDYSGSTFTAAFADSAAISTRPHDVIDSLQNIKEDIVNAKGLFLAFDCRTLYQKHSDRELANCLFNLVELLRKPKKQKTKLAIVFTKMDLIPPGSDFNPETALKQHYPDIWTKLISFGVEFFPVAAVNKTEVTIDGYQVPIENYNSGMSDGLIEPLCWMLDLEITSFFDMIKTVTSTGTNEIKSVLDISKTSGEKAIDLAVESLTSFFDLNKAKK